MGALHETHPAYFVEYPTFVKAEETSTPILSPSSLQHFQFKFHSQSPSSHASLPRDGSDIVYRFGHLPSPPHLHSPEPAPWSSSASHRVDPSAPDSRFHLSPLHSHPMSYSDDYDDLADLPDRGAFGDPNSTHERTVRRRSSKACDQCRKSKCKCERSTANEPCKSCIMLGTPCTFLGPSRKRGPPKGYIDAIEARLHQTEALLGIMLATKDTRAQSLLRDIGKDPLAKEIISRVDNSPYGVKGRKREDVALTLGGKLRSGHSSETSTHGGKSKSESTPLDITSTHPSNEWQDRVSNMLNGQASCSSSGRQAENKTATRIAIPYSPISHSSDESISPSSRRQKRRVDDDYTFQQSSEKPAADSAVLQHQRSGGLDHARGWAGQAYEPLSPEHTHLHTGGDRRSSSIDDEMTSDSEENITGAVGQLSLNEDEQVRYHGKASGLYLLENKERVDQRNEGGIWRFPKARVWPPLPSGSTTHGGEDELMSRLPSPQVQEHLLDLYFTYVHPSFPIVHKQLFLEAYKASSSADSPQSPEHDAPSNTSPFNRRPRRVATLLLLSMYALASRYDESTTPFPSDPTMMWEAGDEYLDCAKIILDSAYASSRPSTCQALLLMGYREIGIGAMAQAWTYIGMAIRMAQDLGLHRSADGWERVGLGGALFSEAELNERKRVWFGCVIMDKYVSTYIGRPLMIYERDFDNTLPSEGDPDEFEDWVFPSTRSDQVKRSPGRIISCFNASASLSKILSVIVETLYAVHPVSRRHAEATIFEAQLDKWHLDLPDHLRWEPGAAKTQATPLPNVLTLHLQYWCAVLLLHRPFLRNVVHVKQKPTEDSEEVETRAIAKKSYELSNAAANHITSIASLYHQQYPINRCSAFLTYYVFTASIMHVTNLAIHPTDPQSRLGLKKCMETLRAIQIVWPSAGRALELFRGAKVDPSVDPEVPPTSQPAPTTDRLKRSAEHPLDDTFTTSQTSSLNAHFNYIQPLRQGAAHPHSHQHQTQHHAQREYTHDPRNDPYGDGSGYLPTPSPAGSATMAATNNNIMASDYSWQGGDMTSQDFNVPLSTAVLPQTYSIGIVDTSLGRMHGHPEQQQHSRRYAAQTQYLGYSPFPQLAPLTPSYEIAASTPLPHQQHHQQQMYIPEQYSIYNNPPYNGH